MYRRLSFKTALLVAAVLLALLYAGLGLLNVVIGPSIIGLISDFQPIQAETPLEGTHYVLDYTNQNLILKNTVTQATQTIIERYSPVALPLAYHLLNAQKHVYVIIRLASGGNSGAYWFRVFNISVAPAVDLMAGGDPKSGLSCTDPRFDGLLLEFELSTNCADPKVARQSYSIPLVALSPQDMIDWSTGYGN